MKRFVCLLILLFVLNSPVNSDDRKPNHLIHEKSPYLLQHAYNPVDWYPWSEEAFAKAKREDKPIFLSIGYSTCHWCHVMEAESYNDEAVARLLNDGFVAIKVDREERPDIDNVYMTVCQMLNGSGGWPLNIVMTPDKKPFFAASYIPKETRFDQQGLMELLPRISKLWKEQRQDVLASAGRITGFLQPVNQEITGKTPGMNLLTAAYQVLSGEFDSKNGGFGAAPKFPSAHQLVFLLHYWKRTGDHKALEMAEFTLQQMRKGGIYDHIGFGFHRYSTDAQWFAPHFEKMLYDQALLAIAYTEAYQVTRNDLYRQTAKEILGYVSRVLKSPEGVFYSAEDADSEGEEGKFYLWKESEIRQALAKQDADWFIHAFGVTGNGNFEQVEKGENILHLSASFSEIAKETSRLEKIRQSLFAIREKRVHPFKDDKVLTDWNGLMIAAFAEAGRVFNEPEYSKTAATSADFFLAKMQKPDGQLFHRYREGQASLLAPIDDYAFLTYGLIELYESTFNLRYLKSAIGLNSYMEKHFWDSKNGGFFFTADNAENLLVRSKEIYDGAEPSGNSVAALNLIRIGRLTGNTEYDKKTEQLERAFATSVEQHASGYTQFLLAVDYSVGPAYEVVIAGDSKKADTKAMLTALQSRYTPNKVVLLRPTEAEPPEVVALAEFTRYQKAIQGKATAYVCLNYMCKAPTTSIDRMLQLLK